VELESATNLNETSTLKVFRLTSHRLRVQKCGGFVAGRGVFEVQEGHTSRLISRKTRRGLRCYSDYERKFDLGLVH